MPLLLLLAGLLFAGTAKTPTRVTGNTGTTVVTPQLNNVPKLTIPQLTVLPLLQVNANPQLLLNAPKNRLLLPEKARSLELPALGETADPAAKQALIETLALEQPNLAEVPEGDLSGAAESDFLARAQLGGTDKSGAAGVVVGDLGAGRSGLKKISLFSKGKKNAVETAAGRSGIPEALKRVEKGERKIILQGPPSVSDLKLISALPRTEVLLTRHRETGQWTLWAGDLHNVSQEGDEAEYDRFYHNHPMIRMPYAVNTVHPSPQDLAKAEGLEGRFMVISESGIVEWNSDTGGVPARLVEGLFDKLVMNVTFPGGYPGLLRRKGVAYVDQPWGKVTQEWLDHGVAPENEGTLSRRKSAAEKPAVAEAAAEAALEAPAVLYQGELLDSAKVLSAEQAVAGMAAAKRNWYYDVVKDDPEALGVLKSRLAPGNLPVQGLENRLKTDAATLGVRIGKVVSVYRYGSSLWGHKTAKPGDVDVLVVVEGTAEKSVQTREAVSLVSEENPKSFLMYMNEEESPTPGALPLNVTVVSREYIEEYQARGGQPEEAEKMDMGELFGDWGHGVRVYGEDALKDLTPKPQHLIIGAAKTERNAGGFMENFIYKIDGRKAQPLSGGPVSRISEAENNKLVPKIYLRYIEMSLRLKTALELQGKDEATIRKLIGDPGQRYRDWITGRAHSELPVVTQKLTSEMIGIHNKSGGWIEAVRKADWTPEMIAKERREFRLRMLFLAAAVLGLSALMFFLI